MLLQVIGGYLPGTGTNNEFPHCNLIQDMNYNYHDQAWLPMIASLVYEKEMGERRHNYLVGY